MPPLKHKEKCCMPPWEDVKILYDPPCLAYIKNLACTPPYKFFMDNLACTPPYNIFVKKMLYGVSWGSKKMYVGGRRGSNWTSFRPPPDHKWNSP